MSSYLLDNNSLDKLILAKNQSLSVNLIGNKSANDAIISKIISARKDINIIDYQVSLEQTIVKAFNDDSLLVIKNLEKASLVDQNELFNLIKHNTKNKEKNIIIISDAEEKLSFSSSFYRFLIPMEVDNKSFMSTSKLKIK